MSIYDKRRKEQKKEKAGRKEAVLPHALAVFREKGIANTKMTDVADRAEIGVASLYRYYKNKQILAVKTAEYFWKEEISECFREYSALFKEEKKGKEYIRHLMEIYLYFYDDRQDIISFIEDFDSYIVNEEIPANQLKGYDTQIHNNEEILIQALKESQSRGEIPSELDARSFAHTAGVSIGGLCRKYVTRAHLIPSDRQVNGRNEIQLLISIFMNYLDC